MEEIMKFRPLYDKLLIKRVEQQQKTSGGIIIPETSQEKPLEGEVIAVGHGSLLENGQIRPLEVKKGDKVLFAKWSGTEVKMDGTEYLIMKESEILGIVE
jgi:chaperonin GroES